MPSQINAPTPARWALALTAGLALSGCAAVQPVAAVDPASALRGRELAAAVGIYGPYDARLELAGGAAYVWRRSAVVEGQPHACELRAETGYRDLIRATRLEGAAGACQAFWIRYAVNARARDPKAAPEALPVAASAPRTADWRPVGAPATTQTASSGR